jgi:hypothetical protein
VEAGQFLQLVAGSPALVQLTLSSSGAPVHVLLHQLLTDPDVTTKLDTTASRHLDRWRAQAALLPAGIAWDDLAAATSQRRWDGYRYALARLLARDLVAAARDQDQFALLLTPLEVGHGRSVSELDLRAHIVAIGLPHDPELEASTCVDVAVRFDDRTTLLLEWDGAYWHADKIPHDTRKTARLLAAGHQLVSFREAPLRALPIADDRLLQVELDRGDVRAAMAVLASQLRPAS